MTENLSFRNDYRKVASYNTSCLEAHVDIYILLMKGIFDAYDKSFFLS